jgi:hypothetical protein
VISSTVYEGDGLFLVNIMAKEITIEVFLIRLLVLEIVNISKRLLSKKLKHL